MSKCKRRKKGGLEVTLNLNNVRMMLGRNDVERMHDGGYVEAWRGGVELCRGGVEVSRGEVGRGRGELGRGRGEVGEGKGQ